MSVEVDLDMCVDMDAAMSVEVYGGVGRSVCRSEDVEMWKWM